MTSLSYVASDVLTITLETPTMNQRYVSSISIGSPSCSFPGAEVFQKSFDSNTCQDSYTASVNIQDLVNICDFTVSSDTAYTTLAGAISVTVVDALAPLHGFSISRTTLASLGFEILLPNSVNITSSTVEILGSIETLAAITAQFYDPHDDAVEVNITTSVQWPYYLDNPTTTDKFDREFLGFELIDESQCPDRVGADCLQVWGVRIPAVASSRICQVEGNFTFSWNYYCQSTFADCPVTYISSGGGGGGRKRNYEPYTISPPTVEVTAELISENVCATMVVFSNIVGTLTSYSDDSFNTPLLAFLSNDYVFLEVEVTADVTLTSIAFEQVSVVQNGVAQVIHNASMEEDPALNFTIFGPEATSSILFKFLLVDDTSPNYFIFDSSSGEELFTFQVQVDLVVTYQTTLTRKKDTETGALSVTKTLVLNRVDLLKVRQDIAEKSPRVSLPSAASSLGSSIFVTGAAVLAASAAVLAVHV